MIQFLARAAVVALALALGGCAGGEDTFGQPEAGYVTAPPGQAAAVDWSKAEIVTVSLSEYEFTPNKLAFRAGAPVRLRLENRGDVTHYFTAEAFFKAIAVESLVTPEGQVPRPYLKSVAVPPGVTKVVRFTPVAKGRYPLECTAPLHAVFGMDGSIVID